MSSSDRDNNEASLNKKIKRYTAILRWNGKKIQISKVSYKRRLGINI